MKRVLAAAIIAASIGGAGELSAQPATKASNDISATDVPLALAEIIRLIDAHYLYPVAATGASIDDVVRKLDASSKYFTPEAFERLRSGSPGAGTGLWLRSSGTDVLVLRTDRGSSADGAGIRAGDALVAIDNESTSGRSLDELIDRLRGGDGTVVQVTNRRRGEMRTSALLRSTTLPNNVAARRIGTVGYLAVASFTSTSGAQLAAATKSLRPETPDFQGLILDLRDCSGGLLDQALMIADHFLDGGALGSQRFRDASDVDRYIARRGDILKGRRLIVLTNARTAAGAEFVAAALQDRGRATVVGMPSFGNGLVQTVIPLAKGRLGALQLTTSAWYRPSGHPIQKVGIHPDVVVAQSREDLEGQTRERDTPGTLDAPVLGSSGSTAEPQDAAPELPPDGYPAEGDFQLDRALQLIAR